MIARERPDISNREIAKARAVSRSIAIGGFFSEKNGALNFAPIDEFQACVKVRLTPGKGGKNQSRRCENKAYGDETSSR